MTNKNLMKKIAPVIMSAAVAMPSMPYAVLASDFKADVEKLHKTFFPDLEYTMTENVGKTADLRRVQWL